MLVFQLFRRGFEDITMGVQEVVFFSQGLHVSPPPQTLPQHAQKFVETEEDIDLQPEIMHVTMGILQMETAAALLVQLRLDSSVFKAENKTETYVLRSVGLVQEIMDIIPVMTEIMLTGMDALTIALLNKAGHVAGELRQQMMLVLLFVGTDS